MRKVRFSARSVESLGRSGEHRALGNIIARFAAAFGLILALAAPAYAQASLREVPLGFCYDSSLSSAAAFSAFTCASFTGTGSGTTLTASAVSGSIQPGQTVAGTGVPSGTTIIAQLTNTDTNVPPIPGRAGTYQTSAPTTSSGASLTTSGAPTKASYAVICAYTQAVNWRDDGTAPTGTAGTGGNGIAAGNCIPYNGTFSQFQVIQQTSSAVVSVNFYYGGAQ